MSKLYENIKNRRKELHMTQSELAERLGYADRSVISRSVELILKLLSQRVELLSNALSCWLQDCNLLAIYCNSGTKQGTQAINPCRILCRISKYIRIRIPRQRKFRHTKETEKPNKINKNPGTLDFTRNSGMYRDWIYNPLTKCDLR